MLALFLHIEAVFIVQARYASIPLVLMVAQNLRNIRMNSGLSETTGALLRSVTIELFPLGPAYVLDPHA